MITTLVLIYLYGIIIDIYHSRESGWKVPIWEILLHGLLWPIAVVVILTDKFFDWIYE